MSKLRRLTLLAVPVLCLAASGCGAARAVATTGETFDRFGCLARDFKDEPPCEPAPARTVSP
ncbi:hypothetical protein [Arvimicrobium flavum]|uniref:hypothetical protein n=1 Tax=Arvimicrobium flavum TaxID=3393320 RepID=UPI00237B198C|nr:hypothetical protein [Mesorhizobium shangrilense]